MQRYVDMFSNLGGMKAAARRYAEEHRNWFVNGLPLSDWLWDLSRTEMTTELREALNWKKTPRLKFRTLRKLKRFPKIWALLVWGRGVVRRLFGNRSLS
jgi:hypothetical protein